MSARKRTMSTTQPADALVALPDESRTAHVRRLVTIGTADALSAAESVTLAADDASRLDTFTDRVERSILAGLTMIGRATLALGTTPKGASEATAAVGVVAGSGEYLGRKFAALTECYRIASWHSEERMEAFVASWVAAHGVNPESVRAYSQWVAAEKRGGKVAATNTVDTLKKRKAASEKAAADAAAAAEKRRQRTLALRKAAKVDGVDITWSTLTLAQLEDVILYASFLASEKRAAASKAGSETAANVAASETGPKPVRKPRTKVAA